MSSSLSRTAALHRIPSLDGLRAVSILLVVAMHTLQRYGGTHPVSKIWQVLFNGGTGVFIFFEISGFLITTLLLKEDEKRGSRQPDRLLPPPRLSNPAAALSIYWRGVGCWAGRDACRSRRSTRPAPRSSSTTSTSRPRGRSNIFGRSASKSSFTWYGPSSWRTAFAPGGSRDVGGQQLLPGAVVLLSPVATTLLRRSSVPALRASSLNYICFGFIMFRLPWWRCCSTRPDSRQSTVPAPGSGFFRRR